MASSIGLCFRYPAGSLLHGILLASPRLHLQEGEAALDNGLLRLPPQNNCPGSSLDQGHLRAQPEGRALRSPSPDLAPPAADSRVSIGA
jgi:hypothetical protein